MSQSDGNLAMVPSMDASTPRGMETWEAHGYEAWIAAWDAFQPGTIAWSGGDDLTLRGWDMRTPIEDGVRQPTFACTKGYVGTRLTQL